MLDWIVNDVELFDIVDKNDVVINSWLKEDELHINDDITRVVTTFVFDEKWQFLIWQRSNNKIVDPGKFEAPAHGRVNSGEWYEIAAQREVYEELWVKLKTYEVVDHYYTSFDSNIWIRQHFKKLLVWKISWDVKFCEKEMLWVKYFKSENTFFEYYENNKWEFSDALEIDVIKLKNYFKNK
jgi:isopentenyldiphosphate isomerase